MHVEGGGSGSGLFEVVDDRGVPAVLGAVGRVDPREVAVFGLTEDDVVGRAAGDDLAVAGRDGSPEPVSGAPVRRADEHAVTVAHDPDCPGLTQGTVLAAGGELYLLWGGDGAGVSRTPLCHCVPLARTPRGVHRTRCTAVA